MSQYYIYVLHLTTTYENPNAWNEETQSQMAAHFAYLQDLVENKSGILVGRTEYGAGNPDLFGIVVFAADSDDDAHQIMNADPAVVHGIMTAQVHRFLLSLLAKG